MRSLIRWCREAAEHFELEKEIGAQLEERVWTVTLTKSYGQWREMTKQDPEMARKLGFKDNPGMGDGETLTLGMQVVPVWMPGQDMGKE